MKTRIRNEVELRGYLANCLTFARPIWANGKSVMMGCDEETRTLAQNSLMWDCLTALQNQVLWHGEHLTKEEWKDMVTAALKGQRVMPSLEGRGFTVLSGGSTSKMGIKEMSDVITYCEAFGAERGVAFKHHNEPDQPVRSAA